MLFFKPPYFAVPPDCFEPFAPIEGEIEGGRHQDEMPECKKPVIGCYAGDQRLDQVEYGNKKESRGVSCRWDKLLVLENPRQFLIEQNGADAV